MSDAMLRKPRILGSKYKICIVASQFNASYTDALVENTIRELSSLLTTSSVVLIRVPGAFEIPSTIAKYLDYSEVDCVIALGVIIKGDTAHANLISSSVTDALMRLGIEKRLPIIQEILLLNDEKQAQERCIFQEKNRGIESARAAARMIDVFQDIEKIKTSR